MNNNLRPRTGYYCNKEGIGVWPGEQFNNTVTIYLLYHEYLYSVRQIFETHASVWANFRMSLGLYFQGKKSREENESGK
jgi:hypothetical protein